MRSALTLIVLLLNIMAGCAGAGPNLPTEEDESNPAGNSEMSGEDSPADLRGKPEGLALPGQMTLTVVDATARATHQFFFNNQGCIKSPESCPARPMLHCLFDSIKNELHIEGTLNPASPDLLCDASSEAITARVVAHETDDSAVYRLNSICLAASVLGIHYQWPNQLDPADQSDTLDMQDASGDAEFYFYVELGESLTMEADGSCRLR